VTTIHAELTADQERIVLMAAGVDVYAIAEAAKQLKGLTPLFSPSDPAGALLVPTTWPAVVQLSNTFGPQFVPGPNLCGWIEDQIARRTAPVDLERDGAAVEAIVPQGLAARPYQIEGALEINRTGRCLIFDEPRTGKTITTILGLSTLLFDESAWLTDRLSHYLPILVVSPASVVDAWVEEFRKWAPYLRTVAWRGPKRAELAGTADVYVTSYDTCRIDAAEISTVKGRAPLVQLDPQSLVVDESHFVKNATAHRTKAVRRLARRARGAFVALSGTPITHHPADLWPALACLSDDAWPARERWVNRYCQVVPGDYDDEILGLHPYTEPEFRLAISGQHRRVARADVMSQLPPKVYTVRTVDLPASWRKAYDDFEAQMLADLPDESGELAVMDALSILTHTSTLASCAADVRVEHGPDVDERTGELKRHVHLDPKPLNSKSMGWKVDALLEILEERPGEAVVAFGVRADLMRMAGTAAAGAGYRVGYVIGGQAARDRTAAIRGFQAGELDLICATTGAGGTGITLSRAGTLVFLQRPWSLVESLQAEDRAEGDMDAERGTEIIDLVARDTIDSRVRAVLRERAGQLSDLVQDRRIVEQLLGGRQAQHVDQLEPQLIEVAS
jgi:SNF2 family DNA or RNA helicase